MSHSTKVTLIADQVITLLNKEINIHDIRSVILDCNGIIVKVALFDQEEDSGVDSPMAKSIREQIENGESDGRP